MIIELTKHGQTVTINIADEHCTLLEIIDTIKGLLVCAGYHPESIDSCFNTGNEWFPEKEEPAISFDTIH